MRDIEHRSQHLCDTARRFLPAHVACDLLLQLRIPAGAARHAGGIACGILEKRAAHPLHVKNGRDVVRTV